MYTEAELEQFQEMVEAVRPSALAFMLGNKAEERGISELPYDFNNCPTRVDRNGPYFEQDVVAAIIATEATLSEMAMLLARQRQRLRDWILRNPLVLDFMMDFREGQIDLIERNYFRSALMGSEAAAKSILFSLGKNRGYTTSSELAVSKQVETPDDGGMDLSKLSEEEILQLEALHAKAAANDEGSETGAGEAE